MKAEKENLIRELLDEGSQHEENLLAGARILRRRRHWRGVRKGATLAALGAAATFFLLKGDRHASAPQVSQAAPQTPREPQVHALTDDELLALFPNTPVGLVSLAHGQKRLVFPRPGDEAKFIRKL